MHIHIHIHHHDKVDSEVRQLLLTIKNQNQKIMATVQQFQAALSKIDEATTKAGTALTAIAARITALEEAVKAQGLTEEQESTILAQTEGVGESLTTIADALTEVGKTPETPVPNPIPDPVDPVIL